MHEYAWIIRGSRNLSNLRIAEGYRRLAEECGGRAELAHHGMELVLR